MFNHCFNSYKVLTVYELRIFLRIRYLEFQHYNKCRPDTGGPGGLSGLPVDYIYNNGVADKRKKTTKVLPIVNQKIDGNASYEKILGYFTTKDISANDVHELGWQMVKKLYPEVCTWSSQIAKLKVKNEYLKFIIIVSYTTQEKQTLPNRGCSTEN